jgi:hypothetical protein
VGGAGLLWLVLGDWSRREEEVGAAERARESEWIADVLRTEGASLDAATAEDVLRLHRTWLRETGAYDPLEDEAAAAVVEHATVEPAHAVEPAPPPPPQPIQPAPMRADVAADIRATAGRTIRTEPLPED